MQTFAQVTEWALLAAMAAYLLYLAWLWTKASALRSITRASPSEVARAVSAYGAVIYDVRSHGYYDNKATRIQGSVRLEPNALNQPTEQPDLPSSKLVYLYCTCVRDATSARVAKELIDKGVQVSVIQGGFRAWKKAGLPIESVPREEMEELPVFNPSRSSLR
jgi:rhodanese-related sulfurtransferase